jgi:hypothetical protein
MKFPKLCCTPATVKNYALLCGQRLSGKFHFIKLNYIRKDGLVKRESLIYEIAKQA